MGAPRALCGRGPFSVRGSAPGPCTRFFTVGSPTRAVPRDPEPRPPDRAAGEADGGWALGPVALGRRVCLLNPLSTAWSELPFPGGRSSPDPEAGLSLLGGLCVACTSHGAAQGRPAFSEFWDVGPDIRSTVSNRSQLPAPRHQLYMAEPDKAEGLPGSNNQGTFLRYARSQSAQLTP